MPRLQATCSQFSTMFSLFHHNPIFSEPSSPKSSETSMDLNFLTRERIKTRWIIGIGIWHKPIPIWKDTCSFWKIWARASLGRTLRPAVHPQGRVWFWEEMQVHPLDILPNVPADRQGVLLGYCVDQMQIAYSICTCVSSSIRLVRI